MRFLASICWNIWPCPIFGLNSHIPWILIYLGLDNGLVLKNDKPLSYPMISQFTNAYAFSGLNMLKYMALSYFWVEFSYTLAPRQRYAELAFFLLGIPPDPHMQWTKYTLHDNLYSSKPTKNAKTLHHHLDPIWPQNWVHIGSGNGLRLVGAKPLPEPMLIHCQLDH